MDSDEPIENWSVFGFCKAGVNRLHDTPVSPRSESKGTEGERVKLADDDNDTPTLNVDSGALGEAMECEAEDQAEQDADKVRTISDPKQPSKGSEKNMKRRTRNTEVGALRVCEAEESL